MLLHCVLEYKRTGKLEKKSGWRGGWAIRTKSWNRNGGGGGLGNKSVKRGVIGEKE